MSEQAKDGGPANERAELIAIAYGVGIAAMQASRISTMTADKFAEFARFAFDLLHAKEAGRC